LYPTDIYVDSNVHYNNTFVIRIKADIILNYMNLKKIPYVTNKRNHK